MTRLDPPDLWFVPAPLPPIKSQAEIDRETKRPMALIWWLLPAMIAGGLVWYGLFWGALALKGLFNE